MLKIDNEVPPDGGVPEYSLDIRSVTKSYPGVTALHDVSFNVKPGEVHVVLGENGAGKSTLIKIISGAEKKDSGKLILNGQLINTVRPAEMRALGISVIYQELSLVLQLDVVSNIFLGRSMTTDQPILSMIGVQDRRGMVKFCRELFEELEIKIDPRAIVGELSVSERQLIEIARAVAFDSHTILMDEPTTSIGPHEKDRLFNLITRLTDRNIGIVFVSHILEDCIQIGDRITVLRDGNHVATIDQSDAEIDELIRLMTGRTFSERYPRIQSNPGRKILEVKDLTRKGIFEKISFDIHEGEIIGFAGLVGAGRTYLMESLYGLEPPDSGEISIFGESIKNTNPRQAIRNGFSLLTEDRKNLGILPNMNVRDNIIITILNIILGEISKRVVRLRQFINFSGAENYAQKLIREMRVKAASTKTMIFELSGGNQQKTLLARAISAGAKIIILDEPTKGVDAGAKVEIYRMLESLVEQKVAVIIVSSELPEVMALSNRIIVMNQGRIAKIFDRNDAQEEQVMDFATR